MPPTPWPSPSLTCTRAACARWPGRRSLLLEFVTGDLVSVGEGHAVVSLGGVGVRVEMPTADIARLSGRVTIYTVLLIRDDVPCLFGFSTEHGRELFHALTSVSKVGPKLALAILSFHAPEALEKAVVSGDHGALAMVPGIGAKTAQRIALELKDKFTTTAVEAPSGSVLAEVREALKGLGYSQPEIVQALSTLPEDGDAQTLLRHALRSLGGRESAGAWN